MADSSPVYIGKLLIENYHAFKGRNELDLIDEDGHLYQWTVFLGNNNTGKTNLLKAIAGLEAVEISSVSSQLYFEPIGTYFIDFIYREGESDEFLIGVDIVEIANFAASEKKVSKFAFNNTISKIGNRPEPFFWWFRQSYGFADNNKNLENLKILGYGVSRKTGQKGISEKNEEQNAASLFNPDSRLTNIEEWLFQLDYASKNGQEAATERLQLVKEIIRSEILPEISDFRFITTEELKNFIEYKTKEGWFRFNELGYGYQTTISWIIDLCKKMFERYPKSKEPLKEPAIVLVDELDLHLHPKWQRTIISYLSKTFPCTQFIVTTHSPLILQTIEKVNLFALVREDDHVNIKHIPVKTFEGWSVEEILAEVMEMEDGIFSEKHNKLFRDFDAALDGEDYTAATLAYEQLLMILHPDSPQRKILKLQLSQIAPVDDKA